MMKFRSNSIDEGISFLKMHGAGNDFVVFDNRSGTLAFSEAERIAIADRRFGIGCDQIVLLETSNVASVFMRLYNSDGGEVSACGNATRCVAWLIMEETGHKEVTIETRAGILQCKRAGEMAVQVDMGAPKFRWDEIPLAKEVDTMKLSLREGAVADAVAVSMGNPHAVFFVEDADAVDLHHIGPQFEHDAIFPERANIEVAKVLDRRSIQLRVWERGAGETLACGTGACATAVAARLKGLVEERVDVQLPGGTLTIEWNGSTQKDASTVLMTGPVAVVYEGIWNE